MMYFCARAQVQYFLANFLETAINHATGNLRIRTREIWLILPEATAFGVRLSHASRELSELGILLSNTWITCPIVWNNLGKLRTMPDSPQCLERFVGEDRMGLRRIRS